MRHAVAHMGEIALQLAQGWVGLLALQLEILFTIST
jgi:hypothetical protein